MSESTQDELDERTAAMATASAPSYQTSEELTSAIDQLIQQAAMLRLKAVATFEPQKAQELYARRQIAAADVIAQHLRDHFGVEVGDLEAPTMAVVSSQLSDILSQPNTEEHGPMIGRAQSASGGSEGSRLMEPIFAPSRVDPDPLLIEVAQLQRHHFLGEQSPVTADTASRMKALTRLLQFLNGMILDDDNRGNLSPRQLWLHLYDKILTYAYTNDDEVKDHISAAYKYAQPQLSVPERLRLLDDVFCALDANEIQESGMLPFMFIDSHIGVQSTAALNFAQLVPLRDGDPMTGPKKVMGFVHTFNRNDEDEQQVAAWIWGLLALGDRRTLPVLRGVWDQIGPIGQAILMNAKTQTEAVTAAHVEFCLEWLETVAGDPKRAVFAAGALGMLANRTKVSGVVDYGRTFPAPVFEPSRLNEPSGKTSLGLTRETQTSPIRVLQRWTAEEYARVIAARLQGIGVAAGGNAVVTNALAAWGVR